VVLLAGGAGGLTLILSRHGPLPERPAGAQAVTSQKLTAETTAITQAVTWIMQQVSRTVYVSCDSQVCTELAQRGFPSLITLGPTSQDPLGSILVVATPAIRAQFGTRLARVYAPAVIASFGSGNARVDIRQILSGGTRGLRADLQARKKSDAQILANSHVKVSAIARAQLLSGDIDPRLPSFIAAITAAYPVRIVEFGDSGPGGGPASLLRSVDLATQVSAAHLAAPAYVSWIQELVKAQYTQYFSASSEQVRLSGGQTVLRIEFPAPSPVS
jgi:hypothetical protein